jgi:hypothetical protein
VLHVLHVLHLPTFEQLDSLKVPFSVVRTLSGLRTTPAPRLVRSRREISWDFYRGMDKFMFKTCNCIYIYIIFIYLCNSLVLLFQKIFNIREAVILICWSSESAGHLDRKPAMNSSISSVAGYNLP